MIEIEQLEQVGIDLGFRTLHLEQHKSAEPRLQFELWDETGRQWVYTINAEGMVADPDAANLIALLGDVLEIWVP